MQISRFILLIITLTFSLRAETVYVTADALFVREKPERSAQARNLAPYGSALEVSFVSSDWAQLQTGGFVSRTFVSTARPPRAKKMLSLHQTMQGCLSQVTNDIELDSGIARYTSSGVYEGGGMSNEKSSGTYTLTPSGLTVTLTDVMVASGSIGSDNKPNKGESRVLVLTFDSVLSSFVTNDWKEIARQHHPRIDRKACVGIYTDRSCLYGPVESQFGFYCAN